MPAPIVGAGMLVVLLAVRFTSLAGVSEFRLPIAVGKAIGLVGLGLVVSAVPSRLRPVWGIWMVGGALNLLAMAISGWQMPFWADAAEAVGMLSGQHVGYVEATSMPQLFLGDSIPIPWPRTAISVGDAVLGLGSMWLAWVLLGPQQPPASAEAPRT